MHCRGLLAIACALALGTAAAAADPVVLAAASTSEAIDAALVAGGFAAVASYAASGVLARQIEQGAPADLFISANPQWMTHLVTAGLVAEDAVRVLMSNTLVLIAPPGAAAWDAQPLAERLQGEVFAMADPATAPVGAYGRAALETLALWQTVSPRFVPTQNTLATVALVANGEAALGLVYASDAAGRAVQVIKAIPTDSHPPIRYLIAPLAQGDYPADGAAILAHLVSDAGAEVLRRHGFTVEAAP